MRYHVEIAHIPAGGMGTIVLLGCSSNSSYGVRIGIVDLALPLKWDVIPSDSWAYFSNLRLAYPGPMKDSILEPLVSSRPEEVLLSPEAEFASGPEWELARHDLPHVLNTVLPKQNGEVTILQFMVERYAAVLKLRSPKGYLQYAQAAIDAEISRLR